MPKIKKEKGPTKRLNVDVPVDVFKQFKVKATLEDRAMTDIVNKMLIEYLSKDRSQCSSY